jgi:hypothetical protein
LRVCENRVLGIFGPKGNRVTGYWRKLFNEERHDSYSSPDIIRTVRLLRMGKGEHVARIEETYVQSLDRKT